MESAKDFLKDKNILSFISFKDKSPHTVELVKDKVDTIRNQQGEELQGVKFLVKENGENKSFFTTSISLLQKLADKSPGDVVTIEMKSRKGDDGQFRSYYEVSSPEDIPVIQENAGDQGFSG